MARYDNRQVRRVGRPVYGRGDNVQPSRRKKSGAPFRIPSKRFLKPTLWLIGFLTLSILIGKLTAVQTVTLVGASATNSAQIDKSIKEGLRKQWFGTSILLVNTGDLKSYITRVQPVVEEVAIKRKLPHVLIVTITERQQGIRWRSGEQVYLLDTKGMVIGESSTMHDQLPLVSDSTNLPVKQGDRVVSRSFISFTAAVYSSLPALGLKAQEMSIPETSSELHIKTEKGYIIKLDTARPAREALADLTTIKSFLEKNKKVPAEYIDLRIPGKAYYR